jgi:heme-degrading monooxygenase HmoA
MAVVALTEVKGDPNELLPKYDKVAAIIQQRAPAPGLLSHTCVELPDGFRVANIWETEQQAVDAFNSPEFQQAVRSAGMEPIRPTIYKVRNHFVLEKATAR